MDYKIKKNKSELDSTGYMEIGPGKYSCKHWQDGSLFIWEDAFGMAEEVSENKRAIILLLKELAESFEQFYETEDWVCILGV